MWLQRLSWGHSAARTTIVSDGCRDYIVRLQNTAGNEHSERLLTSPTGRPKRFASLAQAKAAVSHVDEVFLEVRVAADEACAGPVMTHAGFANQPLV